MSGTDSMTLAEAVAVAERIAAEHPEMIVRAVGRFLPPAELRSEPQRWGVSVLLANGQSTTLWSSLSLSMISPPKRETKAPKRETKGRKHETISDRQKVLF